MCRQLAGAHPLWEPARNPTAESHRDRRTPASEIADEENILPTAVGKWSFQSAVDREAEIGIGRVNPRPGSSCRLPSASGRSIRGEHHCWQSSRARIARRIDAASVGQAATMRARSAGKPAGTATAPDSAPPSAERLESPVFSGYVLFPCPPLADLSRGGISHAASDRLILIRSSPEPRGRTLPGCRGCPDYRANWWAEGDSLISHF
jgi:hypothetical protein